MIGPCPHASLLGVLDERPLRDARRDGWPTVRRSRGSITTTSARRSSPLRSKTLTDAEMSARVAKIQAAGTSLARGRGRWRRQGYAYAGPFRERAAYLHTLEASIYLDVAARGAGPRHRPLCRALLPARGPRSCAQPARSRALRLVGGIALPNDASIALHERFGMTHVGTFAEVGTKVRSLDRRRLLAGDARRVDALARAPRACWFATFRCCGAARNADTMGTGALAMEGPLKPLVGIAPKENTHEYRLHKAAVR